MKSDTRTVNQLFQLDVRYVVPLYQRPYVWNEARQWEPLWEDIQVLLEHQLLGLWSADRPYSHFLGAIVLDQETQVPGRIPLFTVIDGQQRLTTLQVVLAAASRVAKELGSEDDAGLLHDLVVNDRRRAAGDELFKVWPTNVNRHAFKAVMRPDGPPHNRKDDPNNRIHEAYEYFLRRVIEWVRDEPDASRQRERIHTLGITLCDLLKAVTITLEADDNAQVIFETLNARGTPLLALDLVKNAVFHTAARQGLDTDVLYEEVWKPQLEDPYWRKDRRQGRLFRAQGELFLMHWLGMQLRRVIPATELFTTFRKDILQREPKPEMEELIRELCSDAPILRGFDAQPAGSTEALFFERLEALDITTVMPLVLLIFREPAITRDRRRRAIRILESWLVRRSLMGLTTKDYNQQIAVLLAKVASDPAHAENVILNHLRARAGEINRWPSDTELITYLEEHDAYGNIAKGRLVMVLAAVERSLRTNKVEDVSIPKRLSLEHLMPQRWERNWSLPSDLSHEEQAKATIARQTRIHRLGNLTLTTSPLNTALSNAPWIQKRVGLNEHSLLMLNKRLLADYGESFDESAIDERTSLLARQISAIWTSPDSDVW